MYIVLEGEVEIFQDGPGPPGAVNPTVSYSQSVLHGTFVWARMALNGPKRRFPARAGERLGFIGAGAFFGETPLIDCVRRRGAGGRGLRGVRLI
jgi:hypothetical protein